MNDFGQFKEELDAHRQSMLDFLDKAEALSSANPALLAFIQSEKDKMMGDIHALSLRSRRLSDTLDEALSGYTRQLEGEVEKLNKAKESLLSDNILLEYKKKDLLLLTTKLEEANEEISKKNAELTLQQQQIREQADRLNAIHEELLHKNEELERQKEALLDQSDYLHEANERITTMHEEVQLQKNEILKKNEELQALNNEKSNLIGIVAHDLKSPLNQMKGLLSIIKLNAASLDAETRSCLDMMESSATRLTNLIAKILDVEAIESRKLNLNIELVNLSEVLENLKARFVPTASEKSIALHGSIRADLYSLADPEYTVQLFENLLSNAIKFSPAERNVFLSAHANDGEIIVSVRDEGPGLTPEDKKKLFGKYQKLSARPTGNESSSGLGLSIVKKFCEAMNGRIWCESEYGNGATFFVALPRAIGPKDRKIQVSQEKSINVA